MNPYEISQSPERKAYRSSDANSSSSLAIKIFNRNDDDYVIKLCGSKNNNRRRSKSTVRQAAGACEQTCEYYKPMLRNLYRSTFGPTLDETVLVGLETFHLSRQPGGADDLGNTNNEMCWDCSTLLPTNRNSRQYESVTTSTTNSLLDKETNLSSLVTNECQYHPTSSQSPLTTSPSAESLQQRQPRQPRSSKQKSGSIDESTNISSNENLSKHVSSDGIKSSYQTDISRSSITDLIHNNNNNILASISTCSGCSGTQDPSFIVSNLDPEESCFATESGSLSPSSPPREILSASNLLPKSRSKSKEKQYVFDKLFKETTLRRYSRPASAIYPNTTKKSVVQFKKTLSYTERKQISRSQSTTDCTSLGSTQSTETAISEENNLKVVEIYEVPFWERRKIFPTARFLSDVLKRPLMKTHGRLKAGSDRPPDKLITSCSSSCWMNQYTLRSQLKLMPNHKTREICRELQKVGTKPILKVKHVLSTSTSSISTTYTSYSSGEIIPAARLRSGGWKRKKTEAEKAERFRSIHQQLLGLEARDEVEMSDDTEDFEINRRTREYEDTILLPADPLRDQVGYRRQSVHYRRLSGPEDQEQQQRQQPEYRRQSIPEETVYEQRRESIPEETPYEQIILIPFDENFREMGILRCKPPASDAGQGCTFYREAIVPPPSRDGRAFTSVQQQAEEETEVASTLYQFYDDHQQGPSTSQDIRPPSVVRSSKDYPRASQIPVPQNSILRNSLGEEISPRQSRQPTQRSFIRNEMSTQIPSSMSQSQSPNPRHSILRNSRDEEISPRKSRQPTQRSFIKSFSTSTASKPPSLIPVRKASSQDAINDPIQSREPERRCLENCPVYRTGSHDSVIGQGPSSIRRSQKQSMQQPTVSSDSEESCTIETCPNLLPHSESPKVEAPAGRKSIRLSQEQSIRESRVSNLDPNQPSTSESPEVEPTPGRLSAVGRFLRSFRRSNEPNTAPEDPSTKETYPEEETIPGRKSIRRSQAQSIRESRVSDVDPENRRTSETYPNQPSTSESPKVEPTPGRMSAVGRFLKKSFQRSTVPESTPEDPGTNETYTEVDTTPGRKSIRRSKEQSIRESRVSDLRPEDPGTVEMYPEVETSPVRKSIRLSQEQSIRKSTASYMDPNDPCTPDTCTEIETSPGRKSIRRSQEQSIRKSTASYLDPNDPCTEKETSPGRKSVRRSLKQSIRDSTLPCADECCPSPLEKVPCTPETCTEIETGRKSTRRSIKQSIRESMVPYLAPQDPCTNETYPEVERKSIRRSQKQSIRESMESDVPCADECCPSSLMEDPCTSKTCPERKNFPGRKSERRSLKQSIQESRVPYAEEDPCIGPGMETSAGRKSIRRSQDQSIRESRVPYAEEFSRTPFPDDSCTVGTYPDEETSPARKSIRRSQKQSIRDSRISDVPCADECCPSPLIEDPCTSKTCPERENFPGRKSVRRSLKQSIRESRVPSAEEDPCIGPGMEISTGRKSIRQSQDQSVRESRVPYAEEISGTPFPDDSCTVGTYPEEETSPVRISIRRSQQQSIRESRVPYLEECSTIPSPEDPCTIKTYSYPPSPEREISQDLSPRIQIRQSIARSSRDSATAFPRTRSLSQGPYPRQSVQRNSQFEVFGPRQSLQPTQRSFNKSFSTSAASRPSSIQPIRQTSSHDAINVINDPRYSIQGPQGPKIRCIQKCPFYRTSSHDSIINQLTDRNSILRSQTQSIRHNEDPEERCTIEICPDMETYRGQSIRRMSPRQSYQEAAPVAYIKARPTNAVTRSEPSKSIRRTISDNSIVEIEIDARSQYRDQMEATTSQYRSSGENAPPILLSSIKGFPEETSRSFRSIHMQSQNIDPRQSVLRRSQGEEFEPRQSMEPSTSQYRRRSSPNPQDIARQSQSFGPRQSILRSSQGEEIDPSQSIEPSTSQYRRRSSPNPQDIARQSQSFNPQQSILRSSRGEEIDPSQSIEPSTSQYRRRSSPNPQDIARQSQSFDPRQSILRSSRDEEIDPGQSIEPSTSQYRRRSSPNPQDIARQSQNFNPQQSILRSSRDEEIDPSQSIEPSTSQYRRRSSPYPQDIARQSQSFDPRQSILRSSRDEEIDPGQSIEPSTSQYRRRSSPNPQDIARQSQSFNPQQSILRSSRDEEIDPGQSIEPSTSQYRRRSSPNPQDIARQSQSFNLQQSILRSNQGEEFDPCQSLEPSTSHYCRSGNQNPDPRQSIPRSSQEQEFDRRQSFHPSSSFEKHYSISEPSSAQPVCTTSSNESMNTFPQNTEGGCIGTCLVHRTTSHDSIIDFIMDPGRSSIRRSRNPSNRESTYLQPIDVCEKETSPQQTYKPRSMRQTYQEPVSIAPLEAQRTVSRSGRPARRTSSQIEIEINRSQFQGLSAGNSNPQTSSQIRPKTPDSQYSDIDIEVYDDKQLRAAFKGRPPSTSSNKNKDSDFGVVIDRKTKTISKPQAVDMTDDKKVRAISSRGTFIHNKDSDIAIIVDESIKPKRGQDTIIEIDISGENLTEAQRQERQDQIIQSLMGGSPQGSESKPSVSSSKTSKASKASKVSRASKVSKSPRPSEISEPNGNQSIIKAPRQSEQKGKCPDRCPLLTDKSCSQYRNLDQDNEFLITPSTQAVEIEIQVPEEKCPGPTQRSKPKSRRSKSWCEQEYCPSTGVVYTSDTTASILPDLGKDPVYACVRNGCSRRKPFLVKLVDAISKYAEKSRFMKYPTLCPCNVKERSPLITRRTPMLQKLLEVFNKKDECPCEPPRTKPRRTTILPEPEVKRASFVAPKPKLRSKSYRKTKPQITQYLPNLSVDRSIGTSQRRLSNLSEKEPAKENTGTICAKNDFQPKKPENPKKSIWRKDNKEDYGPLFKCCESRPKEEIKPPALQTDPEESPPPGPVNKQPGSCFKCCQKKPPRKSTLDVKEEKVECHYALSSCSYLHKHRRSRPKTASKFKPLMRRSFNDDDEFSLAPLAPRIYKQTRDLKSKNSPRCSIPKSREPERNCYYNKDKLRFLPKGRCTAGAEPDLKASASLRSSRRRKEHSSQELSTIEPSFQEVSQSTPKGPKRGSITKDPNFQEVSGTSPKEPMRGSFNAEPSFQEVRGPRIGSFSKEQPFQEGPLRGSFSKDPTFQEVSGMPPNGMKRGSFAKEQSYQGVSGMSPNGMKRGSFSKEQGYQDVSGMSPNASKRGSYSKEQAYQDVSGMSPNASKRGSFSKEQAYQDVSGMSPNASKRGSFSREQAYQDVSGMSPNGSKRGSFSKEQAYQDVSGMSPYGPRTGSFSMEQPFPEVIGQKRASLTKEQAAQIINGTSPEGPIKGFLSRLSKGKVFGCHNPDENDSQECSEDCACDSTSEILEENIRRVNRGPSPTNFFPSPTYHRQNSFSYPEPVRNENGIGRSTRDRGVQPFSPDDPSRCDPECENFVGDVQAELQENVLSEPPIMCPPCCPVHRDIQKGMPKRSSLSNGPSKFQGSIEIDMKGNKSQVAVTLGTDDCVDIDISEDKITKIMMYSPENDEISAEPRKNRRSIEDAGESENKGTNTTAPRPSRDRSVSTRTSFREEDPIEESQTAEHRHSRRLSPFREQSRNELPRRSRRESQELERRGSGSRRTSRNRSTSLDQNRSLNPPPVDDKPRFSLSGRPYPKRHSCLDKEDDFFLKKKEDYLRNSRRSSSPLPFPIKDPTIEATNKYVKDNTKDSTKESNGGDKDNSCCPCEKSNEENERRWSRRSTGGNSPIRSNDDEVQNTKHRHRSKGRIELRTSGGSETQENAICSRKSGASDNQSEKLRNKMAQETRYAITRVTKYDDFTTYEVLKSTRAKPRKIPEVLEKIFVEKEQ